VEYLDFLIPGIVVWTVAFASFGTGIGLNEFRSVLDRICAIPAALSPRAPPGPARVTTAPRTRRRDRRNP
jgi:hypothetical protein